jgi:hypothetical protein
MENYLVVLFKNKRKKKIIKKFVTYKKAKSFFEKLKSQSESVIFRKEIENTNECNYELGVLELNKNSLFPKYMTDEFGRNVKIKLDDQGMNIVEIIPYNQEEKIFDIQKNEKITVDYFLKTYLKKDGIKLVSALNNKIIVQNDDLVSIFSLKSESETSRFLDSLSMYFFKQKRGDCIFVKDYSLAQRKYLIELLTSKGFDKKIFYRKFTTHPRSK